MGVEPDKQKEEKYQIESFDKESLDGGTIPISLKQVDNLLAKKEDVLERLVEQQAADLRKKDGQLSRLRRELGGLRESIAKHEERERLWRGEHLRSTFLHLLSTVCVGLGCSLAATGIAIEKSVFTTVGFVLVLVGVFIFMADLLCKQK